MTIEITSDLKEFLAKIDQKLENLDQKIEGLDQKVEQKIESLDQKIDRKIENLDQKIEQRFEKVEKRFEKIDQKFEKLAETNLEAQVSREEIKGSIKALGEKVSGLDTRITNQEFTNRGILIALVVAILAGAAKLFGITPN